MLLNFISFYVSNHIFHMFMLGRIDPSLIAFSLFIVSIASCASTLCLLQCILLNFIFPHHTGSILFWYNIGISLYQVRRVHVRVMFKYSFYYWEFCTFYMYQFFFTVTITRYMNFTHAKFVVFFNSVFIFKQYMIAFPVFIPISKFCFRCFFNYLANVSNRWN